MKVYTPEISWHERDPIYTCAFHPTNKNKLATSGVTGVIRLWEVVEKKGETESKVLSKEVTYGIGNVADCDVKFIANLKRHVKSVNVVRWNSTGDVLASAGDEACVFLWKENEIKNQSTLDNDEDENKENWFSFKTFRGHLEDILDISWSPDNSMIISGSIDNSVIIWDVASGNKISILKEPKGFVQGVAYDPLGSIYACLSTDRTMRIFSVANNKCIHNVSKIQMSKENVEPMPPCVRIFYDDTMKSFFRRMCFSPDGNLLLAPSGCLDIENKTTSASFIFTRNSYAKPSIYIPHDKPSVAIACCPLRFELNTKKSIAEDKIDNLFNLPYRYLFAIATEDSVYIYDTQNLIPFSYVTGIHYSNLSDISWSNDGKIISVTSIDGFCSLIFFPDHELGTIYTPPVSEEMSEMDIEEAIKSNEATKPDIKSKLKKQNEINFNSKKMSESKLNKDKFSCDEVIAMDEDSADSDVSNNKMANEKLEKIVKKKPEVLTASKNTDNGNKVEVKTLSFQKKDGDKKPGANSVKRIKLVPL